MSDDDRTPAQNIQVRDAAMTYATQLLARGVFTTENYLHQAKDISEFLLYGVTPLPTTIEIPADLSGWDISPEAMVPDAPDTPLETGDGTPWELPAEPPADL